MSYDVVLVLKSIQSLLDAPNPDSPANSEAADLYKHNRPAYDEKVRKIAEASLEEDWKGNDPYKNIKLIHYIQPFCFLIFYFSGDRS